MRLELGPAVAGRPAVALPPAQPEPFELRLAVFRSDDVRPIEGQSDSDQKVVVHVERDDDPDVQQSSETFWRSSNGTAIFNWRFVFDVWYPCNNPEVLVEIWEKNALFSNEILGAVTLDLSPDYRAARASGQRVALPRSAVRLYRKGKASGIISLAVDLVPKKEAMLDPVGLGREEPNRSPFLDPNDKRILLHSGIAAATDAGAMTSGVKQAAWVAAFLGYLCLAGKIFAAAISTFSGTIFWLADRNPGLTLEAAMWLIFLFTGLVALAFAFTVWFLIGWPPEPDGIEAQDRTRKQWWVECRGYAKGTPAAFSYAALLLLAILFFVLAGVVDEFSAPDKLTLSP